jgi:hypothetical protein
MCVRTQKCKFSWMHKKHQETACSSRISQLRTKPLTEREPISRQPGEQRPCFPWFPMGNPPNWMLQHHVPYLKCQLTVNCFSPPFLNTPICQMWNKYPYMRHSMRLEFCLGCQSPVKNSCANVKPWPTESSDHLRGGMRSTAFSSMIQVAVGSVVNRMNELRQSIYPIWFQPSPASPTPPI